MFAGLVAQQGVPVSLSTAEGAEMVWSEIVTENYFSVLGLRPAVGRTFLPADAAGPGAEPLAVLSHRLWRYRFGGDARVIGRVIRLNGHPFTVVGVAPPGYTGLRKFGFHPDVWVPMMMHGQIMAGSDGILDDRETRGSPWRAGWDRVLSSRVRKHGSRPSRRGWNAPIPGHTAIAGSVCCRAGADSTIPTSRHPASWR